MFYCIKYRLYNKKGFIYLNQFFIFCVFKCKLQCISSVKFELQKNVEERTDFNYGIKIGCIGDAEDIERISNECQENILNECVRTIKKLI
jgi:hypothetical protein